jgi:hypothetical protein
MMIITNKIALNAYIPGIWNNEVIDFITLIVLVFIIYIFSNFSSKTFITTYGNINKSFIIGYIIGLTYPLFIQNYKYRESIDNMQDYINLKY